MVISFKIHDIDDNIFIFLPADIIHAISYKALGIEMKKKIISNSIGEIEKSIIEYLSMRLSIFAREKNLAATFLSSCKSNEWIKQNTSLANYILTEVYTTIDKTMYSLYLLLPKNITLNNKSLSFKKIISINWAVNIPVIIGYSSVRLAELQEVKSGDILLLDTCYVNLDEDKLSGNAYMIINKKDFSCISCKLNTQRDAKASLEIDSFIKGGEMKNLSSNQISSEATSSKAEELGEQILKSIEVIVAIELCRIEMTLPEISSLKKGKLIPLNKDLDNDVFLSINQKIIGCGKLVEIDGKLGVKITGLNI
jgi:flagellar motor switch/type III secretory pathway protein FliN